MTIKGVFKMDHIKDLTTSELLSYYFQFHSLGTKFLLSSVSPLYTPSILFKKDSFPVELVLYADAP